MSDVADLLTDAELAEKMKVTLDEFHALRSRHGWPCVKLGRFKFRFTPDQVTQILDRHTVAPKRAGDSPAVSLAGQTALSASRRRYA